MEIIKGLFPLLFLSIYVFLILNLLIFTRGIKKSAGLLLTFAFLSLSQLCEFLICFFNIDSDFLIYLFLLSSWLLPITVITLVLDIVDRNNKFKKLAYPLMAILTVMLIANWGSFKVYCSLLAIGVEYPSQWLYSYFGVLLIGVAALKLNFNTKNVEDKIETKKRNILLYSIIASLGASLIIFILLPESKLYLESILGKSLVFIAVGGAFYIIRGKYVSKT